MSLVVETGTGASNSESYASVAAADTRLSNLGNDTWATLTTAEKEEALRRSTQFMLQAYRLRWTGYRKTATQALDWPRSFVYLQPFIVGAVGPYPYLVSDIIVPTDIVNACVDLAFKAAAGDLAPDLTRGVIREKVGPIETEYDRNSPQTVRRPAIEMMLAPYLTGGTGMARLIRA